MLGESRSLNINMINLINWILREICLIVKGYALQKQRDNKSKADMKSALERYHENANYSERLHRPILKLFVIVRLRALVRALAFCHRSIVEQENSERHFRER